MRRRRRRSHRSNRRPRPDCSRGGRLHRYRVRSLLALAGLAALLLTAPARVGAQAPEPVHLSPPEIQKFPVITAAFDARDAAGHFLAGLKKEQVTLLENGAAVPADDLKESATPLEVSVALNQTPSMAVYIPDGRIRYQVITDTLDSWATQPAGGLTDHYNLFSNTADPATDLSYRSDWIKAFQALPDLPPTPRPAFDSLTAAIEHAEANPAAPSTTRIILWITSPPEGPLLTALPDLVSRAQKAGLRLFIWSISPTVAFQSLGAQALQQASAQTGGQYAAYSGVEPVPDLNGWFEPLRGQYIVRYTSHARTGGAQSLAVRVQSPDGPLESAPQPFQINLQPPNPILLSPPTLIQRSCPEDCPTPAVQITPAQMMLRILVEFPDGHPRPLTATRLYVDGKLAAERTTEPFTRFDWDLSALTASGVHRIAVEAVDSLGLSRRSIELPVRVEVTFIRIPWWKKLLARPGFLRDAAIGAGLVCLALVMILSRRRIPQWTRRLKALVPLAGKSRGAGSSASSPDPAHASHRFWSHANGNPCGRLVRLGEDERPTDAAPIQILGHELTLGSDPARADVIVEDPSVDRLHARLVAPEEGGVRIADAGTVAGTWVNDEPVPPEGRWLEHGDRVSLGAVAFRYEAGVAPHPRQVVIEKVPLDHDLF